jgi:hypothetical protein
MTSVLAIDLIVASATPGELLQALAQLEDIEFLDIFGDGVVRYPCPGCQGGDWSPAVSAPAAVVRDEVFVHCERGCPPLTRWRLSRLVVEDADALIRLIAHREQGA